MSPAEILQAQKDMHALIATIEGLEHRDIEAQTGAEQIVREIMQLLNDFGIDPQFPSEWIQRENGGPVDSCGSTQVVMG